MFQILRYGSGHQPVATGCQPVATGAQKFYLRAEWELEAHTWQFSSTREYYKTVKYERPTPSQLGARATDAIRATGATGWQPVATG